MQTNQKQIKIFFIANKWCAGQKKYGISEWENGMQSSLKSTGLADAEIFHLDDYYLDHGHSGDEVMLQKIAEYKPDLVYLITNKVPESDYYALQWSTLDAIKNKLKVPMVAIWGDLEIPEQVKISKALLPYTVLNLATASSSAVGRVKPHEKYLYTWVPRDPRIFNNPDKFRDIDVGYVGSPRNNRLRYILYLIKHGVKVKYGGGEGQEHLTTEQYADRYQRSKIALSFSRAKVVHVINARPFETFLCGSMLLEQESFELMKFYTPYVDYVPYCGKKDMLKKARYYLEHDDERERIARNGQKKTEELYSAKRFWQIVIDKALGIGSEASYDFQYDIPQSSLDKLSQYTTFKMKFLNRLCKTETGVLIYKLGHFRYWLELLYSTLAWLRPRLKKLLPRKLFEFALSLKRKAIKGY